MRRQNIGSGPDLDSDRANTPEKGDEVAGAIRVTIFIRWSVMPELLSSGLQVTGSEPSKTRRQSRQENVAGDWGDIQRFSAEVNPVDWNWCAAASR